MILLTCAPIIQGVEVNSLLSVASLLFPHRDNESYLKDLAGRRNPSSASESLFALILLHELLEHLPFPPDTKSLRLARSDSGKPYFKDVAIQFSVSHSHGYVACALSDEGDVGIDIEASDISPEKAQRIADRYFNDEEKGLFELSCEGFKKIWCEKEAKAKYFGFGLGKFLENEKKCAQEHDFDKIEEDLSTHRFYFDKIPIILCTKGNFSSIHLVSICEKQ